jgi:hypothetical protein
MQIQGVSLAALMSFGMALGCSTWRRNAQGIDTSFAPRESVQLWSAGRAISGHGVRVTGDSVRLVPAWQSPGCDSCARHYQRANIDSVRTRVAAPVRTAALATVLSALFILSIYFATSGPWFQ